MQNESGYELVCQQVIFQPLGKRISKFWEKTSFGIIEAGITGMKIWSLHFRA